VKAVEAYCELNVALCYVGVPVLRDKRGRYIYFLLVQDVFCLFSSACTDNASL